jgi:hypothetical protein
MLQQLKNTPSCAGQYLLPTTANCRQLHPWLLRLLLLRLLLLLFPAGA